MADKDDDAWSDPWVGKANSMDAKAWNDEEKVAAPGLRRDKGILENLPRRRIMCFLCFGIFVGLVSGFAVYVSKEQARTTKMVKQGGNRQQIPMITIADAVSHRGQTPEELAAKVDEEAEEVARQKVRNVEEQLKARMESERAVREAHWKKKIAQNFTQEDELPLWSRILITFVSVGFIVGGSYAGYLVLQEPDAEEILAKYDKEYFTAEGNWWVKYSDHGNEILRVQASEAEIEDAERMQYQMFFAGVNFAILVLLGLAFLFYRSGLRKRRQDRERTAIQKVRECSAEMASMSEEVR